ncbi:MAG: D-alanyl-D-alanine carboxypeptidase family protein [Mycobacteriales bacterium]
MVPARCLLRRAATVLALALAVALPLAPVPTGAQAADPVQVAARELAAVRAEVDRTAKTLSAGAHRLEEGRTELRRVRRDLERARRAAGAAQGRSDEARDRLRSIASAAYRSPVPDSLALALTGTPDRYVEQVVARADLDRVRGGSTDVLRTATAARVRAQGAVRSVEQLTDDAARRERDLTAQVAELRAVADRSARKLEAAAGRLEAARAAQRRAARAAQRRAAAVAAGCDGGSTRGHANGFLDRSALCPLDGAPGHALRADAAAAFNRMTAAALASRGARLCVNDSYRSYAGQVSMFRRHPRLAAVPGTSRHGLGVAVDLGCGAERFGSSTHRWLKANAGRYGWVQPAWAKPGGSLPEPWHWEYVG